MAILNKKYFPVLILSTLLISALFLSMGVGNLLAAELSETIASQSAQREPQIESQRVASAKSTQSESLDASIVVERNIFSSTPVSSIIEAGVAEGNGDGGGIRPCPSLAVGTILSSTGGASTGRAQSTAVIEDSGAEVSVGIGSEIGPYHVRTIGWRYVLLGKKNGNLCYLDLYGFDDVLYLPNVIKTAKTQNRYSDDKSRREGQLSFE